uniref:Uncharacterized protein n=1 Tax=Cannabis sativa TaxID=3483 RepID=A0A803QES9_CANSA
MVSKKNNTPNKPATNTTTNPNKPTTKIGRPKIEFDQKLFDKVLLAASPTPVVVKPGEGYWWNEPIEGKNTIVAKEEALNKEIEARAKDFATYSEVSMEIFYEFWKANPKDNYDYMKPEVRDILFEGCQWMKSKEEAKAAETEKQFGQSVNGVSSGNTEQPITIGS